MGEVEVVDSEVDELVVSIVVIACCEMSFWGRVEVRQLVIGLVFVD